MSHGVAGTKALTSSGRFYKWGRAGWLLRYTSSLVEFLCLNRDCELLVIKHPYREHIMFILVTLYLSSVLSLQLSFIMTLQGKKFSCIFSFSLPIDAYESAKLLCEQYYLGAPELEMREMNGEMRRSRTAFIPGESVCA